MTQVLPVPTSKLDFDLQNPRYPPQASQRHALEKILLSNLAKTLKLAEHIVENGQNPIDLIAAYETEARRFVVLEGNRRTAVLKVLNKPVLLDTLPHATGTAAFSKRMKLLAARVAKERVSKVNLVSFSTREDADVWIHLKHTGENEGAGTVDWDGTQSARFRKGDVGLNLLDFGKANGWFADSELTKRGAFPISTFNRLLGDPGVRKAMGVDIAGGKLSSNVALNDLGKIVTQVVADLASGNWNVTTLKSKADRKNYVDQLPKSCLPNTAEELVPWEVTLDDANEGQNPSPKPRVRERALSRSALIPKQFVITTSEESPRLNKIYRELKSLAVERHPNAVAVLLRTFMELSLDDYLKRCSVTMIRAEARRTTLADKANSVAAHLKKLGLFEKDQEGIVHRLVGSGDAPKAEVVSITTLHSFVHSRRAAPLGSELLTIWDNISGFMHLIAHVEK